MKILIAKTAGFCMGVRRAVEMVLEAPEKHEGPICTYGPLIHNPQVLGLLAEKGITVCDRVPLSGSGTILIRAHGVPPQAKERLAAAGFKVIVNLGACRSVNPATLDADQAEMRRAGIYIIQSASELQSSP